MRTRCPHCGQKYELDDDYNGQMAECQKCKNEFCIEPIEVISAPENPGKQSATSYDENSVGFDVENQNVYNTENIISLYVQRQGFLKRKECVFTFDFSKAIVHVSGDDAEYYLKQTNSRLASGSAERIVNRLRIFQDDSINNFYFNHLLCNKETTFSAVQNGHEVPIESFLKKLFDFKLANNGYVEINGGNALGDQLRLFKNHITINHFGVLNFLTPMGVQGEKQVFFDKITAIQIKEPGILVGYIQFSILGEIGRKDGVLGAVQDENTICFINKYAFHVVKYIRDYINIAAHQPHSVNESGSISEEIVKLKKLLDNGVITQDDFGQLVKKLSK